MRRPALASLLAATTALSLTFAAPSRAAEEAVVIPAPAMDAAPASGITATSTHRCASGSPNSRHPNTAVTTVPGTVKDAYAPAAPSTTAVGGTGSVA